MVQAKAFIVPEKQASFQSETVELDALQSGEVLVELKATGICQTDLVVQSGKIPVPFPAILGHEGAAAIMAAKVQAEDCPEVLDTIIAVDVVDEKLSIALELGATHVINSAKEDLERRVAEITHGQGIDAAIDCSGVISVVNSMVNLVGAGGVAVTVGGPPAGLKASIDVFDMLINCKTYIGCHQGNAYSKTFIPLMIDLYRKGRLPLDKLQKTYKVTDINLAVSDMKAGRVWKPVLLWD
ncbi:Metallo-beta-lactamase family protein [Aspergillus niger]|uniref:Metallo-beta-lactamase family protein n=1 Tax=Aspergillus niger TaxID=5061 RepID=A0A505I6D9_ASPNG|nr:Metallo-beta-lactamase family protein [Aspergillus niger]